ncbi:MAG: 3D domain-containing protein [bacterium]|nr:3D domain-containing protein [bacterium]
MLLKGKCANRLHILRVRYHTFFAELLFKKQVFSLKKRIDIRSHKIKAWKDLFRSLDLVVAYFTSPGLLSRLRHSPIYLFIFLATLTFLSTEAKEDGINEAFNSEKVVINEEKSPEIEDQLVDKEIDLGIFLATGYTSHPNCTGEWTDGYTATGVKARYGIVAIDPKVIPLKSKLWVEGYGYCKAEDTGRHIKGRRIDLFFNTYWEAKRYGKKRIRVKLIRENL